MGTLNVAGTTVAAMSATLLVSGLCAPGAATAAPAPAVSQVQTESIAAASSPGANPAMPPAARRAQRPAKTIVRGWTTAGAKVAPATRIVDRIAVVTGGVRLKRRVDVERRDDGGTGWVRVARLRTDDRGRAAATYTAPDAGVWWFRVVVRATAKAATARSGVRPVEVIPPEPTGLPLPDLAPLPQAPAGTSGSPVAVVGDIGECGGEQYVTAQLIDWIDGPLIIPGDVAYPDGSAANFADCYDPFFGRFKERSYPVPGNHEYRTPDAAGYFGYFGARAGTPQDPWYSVDIAGWRFYMLNSNCEAVGCSVGGRQHQWLEQQLAKPQPVCTAAVWHHPRWSSGGYGPDPVTADLYQLLYDNGVDLLLAGHQHHYERLAPLNPAGLVDPLGVRNFTVGTGGNNLRGFGDILQAGSEVRSRDSHGVLRMELGATGYQWAFLPTEPLADTDPGWALCR